MGKNSSRKFLNFITLCRKTNPPKINNMTQSKQKRNKLKALHNQTQSSHVKFVGPSSLQITTSSAMYPGLNNSPNTVQK